ncbi:MAG: MATE family efflux transporter [Lachnospiraceae bacterium]|nr:MATE family efflux transporter [Lachnospiraceae bacterium]
MRQKKYEIDMTSGPILNKLLLFAIPLMASSLLQLLFNAADTIVVGKFAGDTALGAVGSTSALINLMVNLFLGLSVGTNVLVARFFAAKQEKDLSETIHTSILLSFVSGIFLLVIGVLFSKYFLIWMGSPDGVRELSTLYLQIYFLGTPAMLLYNFGAAILRATGDTQRPLYYLIIAGIINVILNLFFVIVFHMSVAGVGIATVISQCVSAFLVLRCLIQSTGSIHFEISKLHIHRDKFFRILQIGLPASFQGLLFSLSNVIIQASVNSFGEITVAGNSAAASIEGFVYVSMNAFHQAAITFTSQNMGAGKKERVVPILLRAQMCVIVTGLILGNLAVFFGDPLLHLYTNNPKAISAGLVRLLYICAPYFLCGMMDVMVGSLRGLGYSVMPMIVSLIGACGLRLIWIFTFFQTERFHYIESLYATYPVSWSVTCFAHIICFIIVWHKIKNKNT